MVTTLVQQPENAHEMDVYVMQEELHAKLQFL